MSARPKAPHVFRAINRIIAEFAKSGIAKDRFNIEGKYHYRSIDDLIARLSPLLAKHGLCVLPRVLRRSADVRRGESGDQFLHVRLLVAYSLVSSRDASRCEVRAWGEALDDADKGTAKAMSAAFKSAMLQLFCVSVPGEDTDASSPAPRKKAHLPEPSQGWGAWAADIVDLIGICETTEALEQLRTREAGLLTSLRSERAGLYENIGEAFSRRSRELSAQVTTSSNDMSKAPAKKARIAQAENERSRETRLVVHG